MKAGVNSHSMRVVARWLNERNTHVLNVKSVKKWEGALGVKARGFSGPKGLLKPGYRSEL